MKLDIARQPLVPAFLTLAAFTTLALWNAGEALTPPVPASDALVAAPENIGLALTLPHDAMARFQLIHLTAAHWLAALMILFTGLAVGRTAIRYNLYSVSSSIAIPLFGIIVCTFSRNGDFLTACSASTLFALAMKNYCRTVRNGLRFDAVFRAALYTGILPWILPAATPLLLLLPLCAAVCKLTLREVVVGIAGILLPTALLCYINWGAGGSFPAPVYALTERISSGEILALTYRIPHILLPTAATILLLDLLALLFFFSNTFSLRTKQRTILLFNITALLLALLLLAGGEATPETIALSAVPSALLIPFMLVRINRKAALLLYALLVANGVVSIVLQ